MGVSTRIGRRISTTRCTCMYIEDNVPKHVEVLVDGNYNDLTRLTNACKKKLNVKQLLVESFEQTCRYYSMPIDTFVKYADQVTETVINTNNTKEN